jgi:hypothetical protein
MVTFNPNSNATSGYADASNTASPTISGVTAGNQLVLVCVSDGNQLAGTPAPAAPTDSTGQTWGVDFSEVSSSAAPYVQILVYRLANAAAGTHNLTLTGLGVNNYIEWSLFELTPVGAPSNVNYTPVSTSVSSIVGPNTGTLAASAGFLLGVCASNNASAPVAAANPSGWTSILNTNVSYPAITVSYMYPSSNAAVTPTWTASGSMTMQAATLFYAQGVNAPMLSLNNITMSSLIFG